jgi:hypothetical protein
VQKKGNDPGFKLWFLLESSVYGLFCPAFSRSSRFLLLASCFLHHHRHRRRRRRGRHVSLKSCTLCGRIIDFLMISIGESCTYSAGKEK